MTTPDKRIKLLHLITLSVVGGAQDNTFSTAELHDRRRFDVHLACNPEGEWIERAKSSADTFHPIPTLVTPIQPWKDLQSLLHLVRLFRREKFDLVHTHTAKAGFLGRFAARLCRVPLLIHTYHAFPFHDFMPAWKRQLYLFLERQAKLWADFFITLSDKDRKEGDRLQILDEHRSRAVYTGIDFSKLDRAAEPVVTRAKLKIPAKCQVVIMAGRLEPQKAPQLMVEAFSKVLRHQPESLLIIAGDGELRAEVETQIKRLGIEKHVRLLGFRDDVPDLLRMADVFAFSSLWEAMGRAMVEAMLLGKPVVAPAIYGIPEIVHHQETGLLYDVGNVDQLAGHLTDLLQRPEEGRRLGRNARELTRELFDLKHMAAQIEGIYDGLLERKSTLPDTDIPVLDPLAPAHLLQTETRMYRHDG